MRALGASRTSVAPGGVLAGNWARDPLWKNARAVPSLDLRFADNKSLVDAQTGANLVSFTRASSATYVGSDGLVKSATTNEARFDHNPTTGESLGLLVEEARTNSIRNNTGVGAVAGVPGTLPTNWTIGGSGIGTLTQQVVAIGSLGSLSYIDVRYSGTTSTTGFIFAFEPSTSVAALTGQAWTQSTYLALIAGSISNINALRHDVVERTVIGGTVLQNFSSDFKSTLTANLTRSIYSVVLSGGATTAYAQPSIEFSFASGVAIDFTIRIGLPQLELGSFATSACPTTTATVTRAADVASITGTAFSSWANNNEGTIFSDSSIIASQIKTQAVWELSGGTIVSSLRQPQGTANQFRAIIGGTFTASPGTGGSLTTGVTLAAVAYSGTAGRLQVGSVGVDATSSALDATSLSIGSLAGSSQLNGRIKRLTFWPVRLANTVLQAITQP
jgi:hypothetical protein